MNRPMTDAEVWGEMAEYVRNDGWGNGLCVILAQMRSYGILSYNQNDKLLNQLYDRYGRFHHQYSFYWPYGQAKPRIRACLTLMRESLERDGQ